MGPRLRFGLPRFLAYALVTNALSFKTHLPCLLIR